VGASAITAANDSRAMNLAVYEEAVSHRSRSAISITLRITRGVITRAKKWGNSLGLILPAEVARDRNIRDGDYLEVEIRRRIPRPDELSGTWKFRRNLRDLIREMKEGWDDL